jgi:exodeoxyribonuclease VII large subunit
MPDHSAQALTVSAVARFLYTLVSKNVSPLWIRGEISNLKVQQNGNAYFSLKDAESKLGAMILQASRARSSIPQLKNGAEVLVFGSVSYYKKEGYVSVFVEEMEFLGEGLLQRRFEELKRKLLAEGLFDPSRKRPIPSFPRVVGVVTSPSGAAVRDILNVTGRRFSGVHIVLFPAQVQGDKAAPEISAAIRVANEFFRDKIDVLIVGRGGGSLEDLWCFNEESVARAIAASKIPVISAVGHEIDFTIADFVADLRAPTPSAAAELVVKDRQEVLRHLDNLKSRLQSQTEGRLERAAFVIRNRGAEYLRRLLQNNLAEARLSLQDLQNRLKTRQETTFRDLRSALHLQSEKLGALNPEKILERGYSITYRIAEDGSRTTVKQPSAVKKGDRILTVVTGGKIRSVVDNEPEAEA